MPGRKRQPTYRRRPRAPQTLRLPNDNVNDAAVRELVEKHSVAELRSLVTAAEEAAYLADKEAQEQPSPFALRRYRSASAALAEVQRALDIAVRPPAEG